MTCLLDANIFIQAKNLYYGLDFCPAFWDWLIVNNAANRIFSIEKIGDELEAGGDELAAWAAQRGSAFFLKPDAEILPALGRVSTWATGQHYEPAATNIFLQVADFYLVAHALAHGHILVTHEIASSSTKKNQNTRRLYRLRDQVHDSLCDAPERTGTLCSGTAQYIGGAIKKNHNQSEVTACT